MDYTDFLNNKKFVLESSGFEVDRDALNPKMFDFEKDIVRWALAKGRSAVFASCGLGKTIIQLEWAHQILLHTGGGQEDTHFSSVVCRFSDGTRRRKVRDQRTYL